MTGNRTSSLASRNLKLGRLATSNTGTNWAQALNTKFVDVTLYVVKDGAVTPAIERHVDDLTTLPETIRMSITQRGARYAVYSYMGRWCLVSPHKDLSKRLRYYDTQEAAEMTAIFNG